MKIGLLGTFGYGNLGDEAIQNAMIQNIRMRYPRAEIVGFSLNPVDTTKRHGIESYPISWMNWKQDEDSISWFNKITNNLSNSNNRLIKVVNRWLQRIPREIILFKNTSSYIRTLDMLIISGGGPVTDYWGGGGPWSFPYTFLKHGILCRLHKVRFVVLSVGVGPINSNLSGRFIRWMLSLSDYCSVRDEFSKSLVHSIGYTGNAPIYPDLAYSLQMDKEPYSPELTHNEHFSSADGRELIGIGPVNYFNTRYWPEGDIQIYNNYLAKLASFTRWLITEKGFAVKFIPGEAVYDQYAIDDLLEKLNDNDLEEYLLRPTIDTSQDLLTELQDCKIIITSRFHGVILSQMSGKPVIGLSYQEKFFDLMNASGQSEYVFPIDSFGLNILQERFSELVKNGAQINGNVDFAINQYRNKLNEQYKIVFSDA